MKKYRLHELIEMAERGEKFEAKRHLDFIDQDVFKSSREWMKEQVVEEWTVRMKREPRVQWISEFNDGELLDNWDTEEQAVLQGKPIKFIEVMENEP